MLPDLSWATLVPAAGCDYYTYKANEVIPGGKLIMSKATSLALYAKVVSGN